MYVLAEHPIKHPNYPNGDHYAVLDTEDGVVEYLTIEELQDYISKGVTFHGNHPLAIKDVRKLNNYGNTIIRCGNVDGCTTILVFYMNSLNVIVEFEDTGSLYKFKYEHFVQNQIHDYMKPTVSGVGIVGAPSLCVQYNREYAIWKDILRRGVLHTNKSYLYSSVDSYFYYFPNFLSWYLSQENYEDLVSISSLKNGYFIQVDKDILFKGNKIYSRDMCTLVPQVINAIFISSPRGVYPVGIYISASVISVRLSSENRRLQMCRSWSKINKCTEAEEYRNIAKCYSRISEIPEEQWAAIGYCFLWYKEQKEAEIKRLAEYWYNYEYEGKIYHCITKECYDALMNWEVDIND